MTTQPPTSAETPDWLRLARFIEALRDTLEVGLHQCPELFGSHAGAFQAQWPDVRELFDTIDKALPPAPPEDETLAARLREHGLTGDQLTLKLNIFSSSLEAFLDELERREAAERFWKTWVGRLEGPEPTGGILRRGVGGRVRTVLAASRRILKGGLRQVLGAADVVFDSLGAALSFMPGPGAAAAAIKEFKDGADVVLMEPDEVERPPRRLDWAGPSPNKTSPPTVGALRWHASQLSSPPYRQ